MKANSQRYFYRLFDLSSFINYSQIEINLVAESVICLFPSAPAVFVFFLFIIEYNCCCSCYHLQRMTRAPVFPTFPSTTSFFHRFSVFPIFGCATGEDNGAMGRVVTGNSLDFWEAVQFIHSFIH